MNKCLLFLLLFGVVLALFAVQPRSAQATPPPAWVTALAWDGVQIWVGAHDGLRTWQDEAYTAQELPFDSPTVTALFHDGQALWAASYEGVARWDGTRWQMWRNGENGLPRYWVTAFTSYEGAVIAGSYGGGLVRYSDGRWHPWANGGPRQITALASNGVTVWATTPDSLSSWQAAQGWQSELLPATITTIKALAYVNNSLWLASSELWWQAGGEWRGVDSPSPVTALLAGGGGLRAATPTGIITISTDQNSTSVSDSPASVTATAAGPYPIVLLHGLNDSDNLSRSNLRFLAQWLREDGYSVYYAPYDESVSLWANRAAIDEIVKAARTAHQGAEVILIGHSFGGLVAKAYAAQQNGEGVAGMITLGTPHAGARLIYDFLVRELANDPTPPLRELLPEHTTLLDPYWNLPTIPQLHIGGNALPRGGLLAGFDPNDGVVSAASATAAPGATRVISALHGWSGPVLQYGIATLTWPNNLHLTTLRAWLDNLPANATAIRATALRLPPAGFTQQQLFDGTLAAGETITTTATLAAEPITWFVDGAGVQMTLIAPDGQRYEDDRVRIVGNVLHLPYRDNVLEPLDLWSTRQDGTWQVILQNQSPEARSVRIALVNPARDAINLRVVNQWVAPLSEVVVVAQGNFTTPPVLRLGEVTYPMRQVVTGLYRAEIPAPEEAGYHALRLESGTTIRQTVVTVTPQGWEVGTAQSRVVADGLDFSVAVRGNGSVLLAVRYNVEGETVWATLLGPMAITGEDTLSYNLPLAPDNASVEWQLFEVSGALMPLTPVTKLAD